MTYADEIKQAMTELLKSQEREKIWEEWIDLHGEELQKIISDDWRVRRGDIRKSILRDLENDGEPIEYYDTEADLYYVRSTLLKTFNLKEDWLSKKVWKEFWVKWTQLIQSDGFTMLDGQFVTYKIIRFVV